MKSSNKKPKKDHPWRKSFSGDRARAKLTARYRKEGKGAEINDLFAQATGKPPTSNLSQEWEQFGLLNRD